MSKTLKIILIVVGVIILLAVLMNTVFKNEQATRVEIQSIGLRNISETVSANGKIQPEVDVKISSQVSGQIIELPVKEGDVVAKGDLLVKIQPDLFESAYNRALAAVNSSKSNLANAKAQLARMEAQFTSTELSYKRSKKLHDQGAISDAEWETAQASFDIGKSDVEAASQSVNAAEYAIASANASLSEARDNLSRTTILAPESGTITALTKELGESVVGNNMMAGDVIMKVSELTAMEIDVEVNESDIVRVNLGDSVAIEVDAFLDRIFEGIVTEIGNTAIGASSLGSSDAVTNFSVKVRILKESYKDLIDEQKGILSPFRPGMSANVEIQTASLQDVLCIPIRAVTLRSDTSSQEPKGRGNFGMPEMTSGTSGDQTFECVIIANDETNKAVLRVVKTGIQDLEYIQIADGLQEGEKIVIDPYNAIKSLKNGDKIKIDLKNSNE